MARRNRSYVEGSDDEAMDVDPAEDEGADTRVVSGRRMYSILRQLQ